MNIRINSLAYLDEFLKTNVILPLILHIACALLLVAPAFVCCFLYRLFYASLLLDLSQVVTALATVPTSQRIGEESTSASKYAHTLTCNGNFTIFQTPLRLRGGIS